MCGLQTDICHALREGERGSVSGVVTVCRMGLKCVIINQIFARLSVTVNTLSKGFCYSLAKYCAGIHPHAAAEYQKNEKNAFFWNFYFGLKSFEFARLQLKTKPHLNNSHLSQLFFQSTFCLHRKMQKNAKWRKWRALWWEGEKMPTSYRVMHADMLMHKCSNMQAVRCQKHPLVICCTATIALVSLDNKLSCGCDCNPPNTMFFPIRCYHFGQRLIAFVRDREGGNIFPYH